MKTIFIFCAKKKTTDSITLKYVLTEHIRHLCITCTNQFQYRNKTELTERERMKKQNKKVRF